MMNKYTKSTRSRLEMAERQNRWLTIIAIATIITLLIAAAGGPTVIRDAAKEMFDGHGNEISALPPRSFSSGVSAKLELNFANRKGLRQYLAIASRSEVV